MKTVINLFVLFLVAISFAACEKAVSPTAPVTVDKSANTYNGSFEVTFKDYKNSNRAVSVSGSISFNFNPDNTYSYDAVVVSSAENEVATSLHDNGTFHIKQNNIEMSDDAARMMNPTWQQSLYLSGTYSYRRSDTQTMIEGSGEYGSIRIVLNNQ